MKTITINNGKEVKVDDDIYEIVSKYKWFEFKNSVRRAKRMDEPAHYPVEIILSRFIMGLDGPKVYFKDGDFLNHQRENLWLASKDVIMPTKRLSSRGLPKGVTLSKCGKSYIAKLNKNYLGIFKCPYEAALVYRKAELAFYPDFARSEELWMKDLECLDAYKEVEDIKTSSPEDNISVGGYNW